ncbi:MAG: TonB-dependent receptor [Candidatus Korobacteraceae bacterium]
MRIFEPMRLGIVLVLLLSGVAVTQTQFGQVSGRVTDEQGAILTRASVTVTNLATGIAVATQTNSDGMFVAGNIPPGEYSIAIESLGFSRISRQARVAVAQRIFLRFTLPVEAAAASVSVFADEISAGASSEVARPVTAAELRNLPLLTRDPYDLMALAPGAVNTSVANGNDNGIGIAVAGARNRSINFLLDGSENNEAFSTGPGTLVPFDAIQELKVQSNSMTAEFGRNTVQANVITRSGGNQLHGSLYEYHRGSALSSLPVEDKANGLSKSRYVRNLFGGSMGGAIVPDRTFYFGSLEGLRVRSSGRNFYYVPTGRFLENASENMAAYIGAGGGLPTPALPDIVTAADIIRAENGSSAIYGDSAQNSLFHARTGVLIPAETPLFQRTMTQVPIDAGGGTAQNTWKASARIDHQLGEQTNLSGRWAWFRQLYPVGASSDSPYSAFNTGSSLRSQNSAVTLTHAFSPTLSSAIRLSYNRTAPQDPLGEGSVDVQCLQYGRSGSLGTGAPIVLPGYAPSDCASLALPGGGPQNNYSLWTGFTYSAGRHIWKWGAYGRHLRDNRSFGAFANAFSSTSSVQGLLRGRVDQIFAVAIDPRGKVPGETYNVASDGPVGPPSFTRHYRYNEIAFYAEDQVRLTPNLSLTAGLRWEYFGVLHSPDGEKSLDANLFLDMAGTPASLTPGGKSAYEQIRDARFARTGNFYRQDFNNFAPRLGLAWDVLGNSQTIFRAGYGIYYDSNFGNALFNVIQNPPNYAVITLFPSSPGAVMPNQYDTLASLLGGSGSFRISSSARMLDRDMATAYSQQWNATLEHDLMRRGVFVSVGYVGSKGDKLYSLNNLNQRGSCILLGSAHCSSPLAYLNQSGVTAMNRRGNEGFSRYHAMQAEVKSREIPRTGLQLAASYTWAHSIDNNSSFFNETAFEFTGGFGFRDPFNPAGDKADSSNDVRQRLLLSYVWQLPWGNRQHGMLGKVFGGWAFSGIFSAQTGTPFSVYEDGFGAYNDVCSLSGANACYPVVTGAAPQRDGRTATGDPNRFVLYDFGQSLISMEAACGGDLACTQQLYFFEQDRLLNRNTFRAPGYWNTDVAVLKDFRLPGERTSLQFRAEFFNVMNHSNLYADPNTNRLSAGAVRARRGVPPGHELYGTVNDRRNIQLGLHVRF